jgi:hypothetical protein
MIAELKKLIDQSHGTIHDIKDNHEALCALVGLDTSNGYSEAGLTEAFRKAIRRELIPHPQVAGISFEEVKQIEEALVWESVITGCDNKKYIDVVEVLRHTSNTWIPMSETNRWMVVLQHAKNFLLYKPESPLDHSSLRDHRSKAFDIGTAAKQFLSKGYPLSLEGNNIQYENAESQIVADLEKKIALVGGYTVIARLTQILTGSSFYIPEFRRYAISSRLSFLQNDCSPMIPFGYLFNLSVKHPYGSESSQLSEKQIYRTVNEIIDTATQYATLYGVQPYNIWEVQFRHQKKFGVYLQEVALFDSIYTLPSCDPVDALAITEGLFKWIDEKKMIQAAGFSSAQFQMVCRKIVSLACDHGPSIIYLSRLKKELPMVENSTLCKILVALSSPAAQINKNYFLLADMDKHTSLFTPLIAHSSTKYSMPDLSWSAPAFYEAMASIARVVEKRNNIADKSIGDELENFIKLKLKEKGVSFSSGKYLTGTAEEGQCDVLIETAETILIIEIKKKALTRISRSGRDAEILADLSDSLLDAQIQTGKVELLLLKEGYVELEDEHGVKIRIDRHDKRIERIAVSLHEFGAFQDRTFITAALRQLIDSKIDLNDTSNQKLVKKYTEINEQIKIWTVQAAHLQVQNETFDHFPYYDCWFISLPQLLVLLRYTKDNISFHEALRSIKSVSLGSSNFYFEFLNCFVRQFQQINKMEPVAIYPNQPA